MRVSEMAGGQVVRVKRQALEACMTCPLCNKLLKEATTISLCLHTFCRKCIYEKLSDEEMDCCPVCEIDLGCTPVEKLRPDHNLQDIRAKMFPIKRWKVNAPEVSPSISLPVKRKERSLSSLVVSTPKVSMQAGVTGKRSRALTRKAAALRGCSFSSEEPLNREDSAEDQDSSMPETSYEKKSNKEARDDVEIVEGKADLWTPLNCLVEAANRTKSSKSNSQGQSVSKSEPLNALNSISELYMPDSSKSEDESPNAPDSHVHMTKTKIKDPENSMKGKKNNNGTTVGIAVKRKRFSGNRNRVAPSRELPASSQKSGSGQAQGVVDSSEAKHSRRNSPIWFSLVASENWKGDASLPQISACYLRIKDGKMPVTFIQKYLVKKLELTSESEVEIMCRGEPVHPTLELQNLVDMWFKSTGSSTKKLPARVGSSAKDFVMVLSYCPRVQDS